MEDDIINACFKIDRATYNQFRKIIMGKQKVKEWIRDRIVDEIEKDKANP